MKDARLIERGRRVVRTEIPDRMSMQFVKDIDQCPQCGATQLHVEYLSHLAQSTFACGFSLGWSAVLDAPTVAGYCRTWRMKGESVASDAIFRAYATEHDIDITIQRNLDD